MRRRKPDTIEVQQMKQQAKEEKLLKEVSEALSCYGRGGWSSKF